MDDLPDPSAARAAFPAGHYHSVGRGYFDLGQFDRAAEVCRRGVADDPDDGRLWELLGAALWAAGEVAPARDALEQATALVPLGVPAQLVLADCYLKAGPAALAGTVLRHLARREVCPPECLPRVAALLFEAGDFRRAAAVWHRVRRATPGWAEAHYRYALARWALDVMPEELLEPLNEAALLAPEDPRYALALANVWGELGDVPEAAASLANTPPGAVRCAGCLRQMAAIYTRAGDAARAAECEARAIELTGPGYDKGDDTCGT